MIKRCISLVWVALVIGTGTGLNADSSIVNTFGSGTPGFDVGSESMPPYAVGDVDLIPDQIDHVQWAMPFEVQWYGRLTGIRLALATEADSNDEVYAHIAIVNDVEYTVNNTVLHKPTNVFGGGGELLFRQIGLHPKCQADCGSLPDCTTCIPLSPVPPVYEVELNLDTPLDLAAGKYWLVLSGYLPGPWFFKTHWYRSSTASTFASPHSRNIGPDNPYSSEAEWVDRPGNLAAFEIRVAGVACTQPSASMSQGLPDSECDQSPPIRSSCWWSPDHDLTLMPNHDLGPFNGYPLNLNLWQGFGPSDYPPRSLVPELSSLPLVSKGSSHFAGPSPFMSRPMHNDVIDIITGQPLIQAVDFELPFGGATFRHVRTYSENSSQMQIHGSHSTPGQPADGTFWDWNGRFWMMSENPILLVDAAYHDMHGSPIITPDKKRCYFIPDAHHAIPFLYDQPTNSYVAPSWFDAQLIRVPSDPTTPATHFYCWLNRKSIKYTFEVRYEDIWDQENGTNAHVAPSFEDHPEGWPQPRQNVGGLGIPHYALLTGIEDNYGNRVEYDYTDHIQTEIGGPPILVGQGCRKCQQNCNEKGQLRTIRLIAKNQTVWTLVYTHRAFPIPHHPMPNVMNIGVEQRDSYQQHHLHSIHVYEGSPVLDLPESMTIPSDRFCRSQLTASGGSMVDALDAIDHDWLNSTAAQNWVLAVKYLYSENGFVEGATPQPAYPAPADYQVAQDLCANAGLFGDAVATWVDSDNRRISVGERLLKTTVIRKTSPTQLEKQYCLYRDGPADRGGLNDKNGFAALKFIYEPDTVARILDARREEVGPGQDVNPNFLFARRTTDIEWDSWGSSPPPQNVSIRDPETNTLVPVSLAGLADIEMKDFSEVPNSDQDSDDVRLEIINSYIHSDPSRTVLNNVFRRSRFIDRRATQKQQGEFRFHYFVQYPTNITIPSLPVLPEIIYHFPYQFMDRPANAHATLKTAPLDQTFFVTVVDELNTEAGLYDPAITPPRGVRTRRVVQMNPAGFVLKDETWSFETDPAGQVVSEQGFAETYKRDCMGRLTQKRSTGFSVAENQGSQEQEGLIEVFQYQNDCASESDPCGCSGGWISNPNTNDPGIFNTPPGELIAIGVKRGTNGQFTYRSSLERAVAGHPELITKQISYPTAVSSPNYSDTSISTTHYEWADAGMTRMVGKTVIGPPSLGSHGGELVYPIEKFHYDESGNMDWHGTGLVDDDEPGATPILFSINYTQRNDLGQTIKTVTDTDGSGTPGFPSGWSRAGYPAALNLTTTFQFEIPHGLKRVVHPNDREMHIVNLPYPEGSQQIIHSDLVPVGNGYLALSPAKVRTMRGNSLLKEETVKITAFDGPPDGDEPYDILATTTPKYDEHGRLVGMKQSGDAASVSAAISYDGFGNIGRQQDPDGTITRNVYDERGRLARVYRGTNDQHEYWSTARLCGEGETPQEHGCVTAFGDNLVLIEKRYYGDEITNAGELVTTRHYRDRPINQYHQMNDEEPPVEDPPSNEDAIGTTSHYDYDWRMRPVVRREHGASLVPEEVGPAIAHEYTWYDNQDRPRLIAEYGAGAPASPNPVDFGGQHMPPAEAILSASPPPISLTENVYNARGQVQEVRRYNVSVASGSDYTATLTYYDHAGRAVEVHAPNSPIRRNEYDAKGRLIATRSLAGEIEVSRTETIYDNDDRAIKSIAYQRVHNSTTGPLTTSNAIRTYSHSWYDLSGRVIASANFGTNHENGYVMGDGPDYLDDAPVIYENNDPLSPICGCNYEPYQTVAPRVQLSCYKYDDAGRQVKVWHPDGTATQTVYDGIGRTVATIENVDSANAGLVQRTDYDYDTAGRLFQMRAVIPGGTEQVTKFTYGATVVSAADNTPVSNHNGWIKEVQFPDGTTGRPSTTDILTFTYYSNGAVASRTDPRGIVFKHQYDELGRRIETEIDDQAWYTPPDPNQTSLWPPNRIRRINYAYDIKNRLETITAYRIHHGVERLFCQNKYEYDAAGRLFREWQAHEDPVSGTTPFVQYNWQSSSYLTDPASAGSGYNFERLAGIVYPPAISETPVSGRTISYGYGESLDDIDGRLSRITRVGDSGFPNTLLVDQYQYCGVAQRIRSVFGNLTQTYADASGYPGLDQFGRVKDLNYQKANNDPLLRYQYGYDLAGNRTFARITHQPTVAGGQTLPHDNDRSYLYGYDTLNRLTSAERGQLSGDNSAINPAGGGAPLPTQSTWRLDSLGNWTGNAEGPGLHQTGDVHGSGVNVTVNTTHFVDHANRIGGIAPDFPPTNVSINMNDVAGNLASDGIYYYQYDAWNRLVQVNEMGSAWLGADGRPSMGQLGPVVARYAYDGLGRLIRKQSAVNTGQTYIQSKDFYYDGVRRIQEVIFRPPLGSGLFEPEHGNDEGIILPSEPIDPTAIAQIILGADPGSVKGNVGYLWTDREYVYDPAGDVDAFIYQVDKYNRVMYMLQDANLNVVGLVAGPTTANQTQHPWPAAGTLLEQYVYEPYGKVIKSDSFHAHPVNRVGHQGLFFERYDADFSDQTLAGSANGLYYNRNRFYHPGMGRFTTRDPNETGMPVLMTLAMNATAIDVFFSGFNGQSLYGDGMNLYEYANSNPVSHRDALGLYDDFDDMISEINGHRLYAIGTINEGARVASIGLGFALDIAMGFMPGAGIYDAVQSIKAMASGGGGFWDALNVLSVAMPGAKMLSGGIDALRSMSKARQFARRACNSFVAGTPVETPNGPTAIECLKEGDAVWTQPQDRPDQPVRVGRVTRLFRGVVPAILWITLSTGDTIGATPGHKIWTFEQGWTTAERLTIGESFRTIEDTTAVVINLRLDTTPTQVYDLEVDGTFTYYVNGVWVHNKSCTLPRAMEVGHHIIPKFLNGWLGGRLTAIPDFMHREFHRNLRENLAHAGIGLPENAGRRAWEELIADPDTFPTIKRVLVETTSEFDRARGLNILPELLNEMRRQRWH